MSAKVAATTLGATAGGALNDEPWISWSLDLRLCATSCSASVSDCPSEEGSDRSSPVVLSFRALSGRITFTVRRHKSNNDSLTTAASRLDCSWCALQGVALQGLALRDFGGGGGCGNGLRSTFGNDKEGSGGSGGGGDGVWFYTLGFRV